MPKGLKTDPPKDTLAIREQLAEVLNSKDSAGRTVGSCKHGIYAFFDYDGEPIYVGQTLEGIRTRIRRHITNQRTDAVAMNVLDPFEVCDIEMWPFWRLKDKSEKQAKKTLGTAEYTVSKKLIAASTFNAILNEAPIPPTPKINLPPSKRGKIIPSAVWERRKHPDIRIARRASVIAKLAQVISERQVKTGLRNTLLIQARRLEHLAQKRLRSTT